MIRRRTVIFRGVLAVAGVLMFTLIILLSNRSRSWMYVYSQRDTAGWAIDTQGLAANTDNNLDHAGKADHQPLYVAEERNSETVSHKEGTTIRPSSKSTSYRARPELYGRSMELNKVSDNYSFCPGIAPFLGPFDYMDHTKSPCWWDNGVFRCLPYFYIAGFSKCGTTDLFFRISRHPHVVVTGLKEKHWFDYERFIDNRGLIQNYTNRFNDITSKIVEEMEDSGQSAIVIGDGSPSYIWGSLAWPCYEGNEGLEEPRYTNADVIHHLTPKAKIIVLVREPVNMLLSRMQQWTAEPYLHPAYRHPSPESFHDHIAHGIDKYTDCFSRHSVRQCAYNGTLYAEVRLRLQEGMYSVYLADWLKVFPSDQILILRFEDYVNDMRNVLRTVYAFLDLAPVSEDQFEATIRSRIANKGKHHDVGDLLDKTRKMLEDFYRPFVKELSDMLGDNRFAWHYTL